MPDFDELIHRVRHAPGMYFDTCSVSVICAWLQGYDTACEGGLLRGFREWLIVMTDGGNNLTWQALIANLVKNSDQAPDGDVDKLLDLVAEFRSTVKAGGMRRIMVRYHEWLQRQPWYGAESPDFLPLDE